MRRCYRCCCCCFKPLYYLLNGKKFTFFSVCVHFVVVFFEFVRQRPKITFIFYLHAKRRMSLTLFWSMDKLNTHPPIHCWPRICLCGCGHRFGRRCFGAFGVSFSTVSAWNIALFSFARFSPSFSHGSQSGVVRSFFLPFFYFSVHFISILKLWKFWPATANTRRRREVHACARYIPEFRYNCIRYAECASPVWVPEGMCAHRDNFLALTASSDVKKTIAK